ncbi:hypothetical protein B7R22_17680 [Subtercola boreus]|uniref:Uncharacterized protein n=1 Tax=Subtercola boreus TaxID=120213 RepID=A0A3E0VQR5_9MICO|nr:hypothetical protein B7R22_17680 [Subtercola boreus]
MDIFHSHTFRHGQRTDGCRTNLAAAVRAFCGFPFRDGQVAALDNCHSQSECLKQPTGPLHSPFTHSQHGSHSFVGGGHTTPCSHVSGHPVGVGDTEEGVWCDLRMPAELLTPGRLECVHNGVKPGRR